MSEIESKLSVSSEIIMKWLESRSNLSGSQLDSLWNDLTRLGVAGKSMEFSDIFSTAKSDKEGFTHLLLKSIFSIPCNSDFLEFRDRLITSCPLVIHETKEATFCTKKVYEDNGTHLILRVASCDLIDASDSSYLLALHSCTVTFKTQFWVLPTTKVRIEEFLDSPNKKEMSEVQILSIRNDLQELIAQENLENLKKISTTVSFDENITSTINNVSKMEIGRSYIPYYKSVNRPNIHPPQPTVADAIQLPTSNNIWTINKDVWICNKRGHVYTNRSPFILCPRCNPEPKALQPELLLFKSITEEYGKQIRAVCEEKNIQCNIATDFENTARVYSITIDLSLKPETKTKK